ncbi:glycosyltransferase family 4 protein [Chloroflexota bacterium]
MAKQGKKELRICLCAFPFPSKGGSAHLVSVARIIQEITDKLCVIAGSLPDENTSFSPGVKLVELRVGFRPKALVRPSWLAYFIWVIKYPLVQLEMSYHLLRASRQADIVVFETGIHYLLPILLAKLLRKKVVKRSPASIRRRSIPKLSLYYWVTILFKLYENAVFGLADRIVIPTVESIHEVGMGKYEGKLWPGMYMWVTDVFQEKKDWHQRGDVVGYVGRLIEIKGVLQLAKAIPLILEENEDIRFLIVGDGVLMSEMQEHLKKAGCLDKVEFTGWVPNDELPDYLNEMKFHILPSYWEAPGAVNLEAMACGTIAVGNNVGGIPDIVIDNETGFLLRNNDPETIANKIVEVWNHPGLEEIRQNAKIFVEQNYTYNKVVEDWRRALSGL